MTDTSTTRVMTPLERVARAIMRADAEYTHDSEVTEEWLEANWYTNGDIYMSYARAAITALLEPTKEMIEVGNDMVGDWVDMEGSDSMGEWFVVAPTCSRNTFRAMLAKALEEK